MALARPEDPALTSEGTPVPTFSDDGYSRNPPRRYCQRKARKNAARASSALCVAGEAERDHRVLRAGQAQRIRAAAGGRACEGAHERAGRVSRARSSRARAPQRGRARSLPRRPGGPEARGAEAARSGPPGRGDHQRGEAPGRARRTARAKASLHRRAGAGYGVRLFRGLRRATRLGGRVQEGGGPAAALVGHSSRVAAVESRAGRSGARRRFAAAAGAGLRAEAPGPPQAGGPSGGASACPSDQNFRPGANRERRRADRQPSRLPAARDQAGGGSACERSGSGGRGRGQPHIAPAAGGPQVRADGGCSLAVLEAVRAARPARFRRAHLGGARGAEDRDDTAATAQRFSRRSSRTDGARSSSAPHPSIAPTTS